ncbi:hypothetical protein CRENPOLYSF2_700003 [Crenothrix polyspora]|uniref:Uncharacterized protein n=1 Tax=Crenothrix polyspora TaxID=360316 RepID=A0A1R4HIC3_9GAMM|nr:hypothetical protein CRENPOLYSF2_700003 [Crenothrix polyspora]
MGLINKNLAENKNANVLFLTQYFALIDNIMIKNQKTMNSTAI